MKKFLLNRKFFLLLVLFILAVSTAVIIILMNSNRSPRMNTKQLTGVATFTENSNGNKWLPGTPYGYEIWSAGRDNYSLTWYGADKGGGAAFRAEWDNPNDFLGRVGYFWNEGHPYTHYGNLFCDFNYTRSADGTGGRYSYLGIYGWTRDPMIEWYIVEDWFGYGIMQPANMGGGAEKMGEFTCDGEVYFIYKATRTPGAGNIEGTSVYFPQYFSVRQSRRQSGTISITEHFKEWERIGLPLGSNLYEAKFLIEAASGRGWFDAAHIEFYRKD